ncbi:HPF/RaiA family ribosome-associated protein [Chryseolinea lacunae]|uniref:Ribosome-associated translation inhibitor RaiA n=1 Tax=Chryseolinea lacunae TaxID=2801331 RepID=A0ABS1KLZ6_9BACT|nr:HPF/RaiA family ribosome-associated protein [Chryseolinea lacunae]MBL0740489.1 ribosome-associated translation inhibitor RaiA [Chryseolinea lacunae]
MKITIQTPGFTGKPELLKFAEEHVQKFSHLSDRIMEGKVVLHIDKSDEKKNKVCDIRLAVPGNDLFATKTAGSFEEAIADTCQALRKQVEGWKELPTRSA